MADCTGLWRRRLLIEADGTRDTGTDVVWLQGISVYVDSRGFAGRLDQRGEVFQWIRLVDTQPPSQYPDVGRMHWDGVTLVETGMHTDYVEHWVREHSDRSPAWGMTVRGPVGDDALLLRVGGAFGWASAERVIVGAVDDDEWVALGAHLHGDELRANGGRWKITTTEGIVNL
jgi:hypothetical protein